MPEHPEHEEEWVPYQGYQEPKQHVFWQVFDVVFILALCYACLLVPILLSEAVLVGGE
jgi:hypothetical protein